LVDLKIKENGKKGVRDLGKKIPIPIVTRRDLSK